MPEWIIWAGITERTTFGSHTQRTGRETELKKTLKGFVLLKQLSTGSQAPLDGPNCYPPGLKAGVKKTASGKVLTQQPKPPKTTLVH